MKQLLRGEVLLSIVALALAATVAVGREKPTLEPMEAQGDAKPNPVFELDLSGLDRSAVELPTLARDPFATRSFTARRPPAEPAPAPQAPAPRPVAEPTLESPPLPFRYVGRMVDEEQTYLFLARGNEVFTAQAGQTFGAQWRIDEITASAVVFTYLPHKTKRSLSI